MILRRDKTALAPVQQAGLVLAAMAKFQLVGIAAGGQRQQLVAEADAHRGDAARDGRAQRLNGSAGHLRVARSVRDQDTVEAQRMLWREEIVVPGHANDAHAPRKQAAHNIALGPAVDQRDRDFARALYLNLSRGDAGQQVLLIWIVERDIPVKYNLAQQGAMRANMLSQPARILDFQRGNPLAAQPGAQVHRTLSVRGRLDIVRDDQAGDVNAVILPGTGLWHAVVADDWVGHSQNLAGVRGVGERFRVSHHASAEDHLARDRRDMPEGGALKARPVFQDQFAALDARNQQRRLSLRVVFRLRRCYFLLEYHTFHAFPSEIIFRFFNAAPLVLFGERQ